MFFVYITASAKNGTLYAGHCEDLAIRIQEHKDKSFGGFTARYGIDKLVWFESHPTRDEAFRRERQIKEWKRLWKLKLIEARNPNWVDLFPHLDRLLQEEDQRWIAEELGGVATALAPGKTRGAPALHRVLPGSRRSPG